VLSSLAPEKRSLICGDDCTADLRKLGYSMRVERSTVDQVKNRLQSLSKRKWDPLMTKKLDAMEGMGVSKSVLTKCDGTSLQRVNSLSDYEKKVREAEEEEARVKRQKKEQKKAKKLGKSVEELEDFDKKDATEKKPENADQAPDAEAEMMAMMGFGGFGGSKKS